MLEAKTKGSFSLITYKIKKFSLTEPSVEQEEMNILFNPSGIYFKTQNRYKLIFDCAAVYGVDNENEFITATMEADFQFEDIIKTQDIPSYFYANSIAIVFPYMRAFITTLSAVANIKPLILPTLNLTFLEQELKDNTTIKQ